MSKLLMEMVKIDIWPFLKKRGYKKRRLHFALTRKDSIGMISFYPSRWGFDYYIDFGISFFGIKEIIKYGSLDLPEVPSKAFECQFCVRLENIILDIKDGQWICEDKKLPSNTVDILLHRMGINENTAPLDKSREIFPILRDNAVPWLEKHMFPNTFIDMKMKNTKLILAGYLQGGDLIGPALMIAQGKRKEAEDYLERYYYHVIDLYKNDGRFDESEIKDTADRYSKNFSLFAKRNGIRFEPTEVVDYTSGPSKMGLIGEFLEEMVAFDIWPYLKEHGYKKNQLQFLLFKDGNVGIISIEPSSMMLPYTVLVSLGISFPQISEILGREQSAFSDRPSKVSGCQFQITLFNIVTGMRGEILVYEKDKPMEISKKAFPFIRDYAAPWLEKHMSPYEFIKMKTEGELGMLDYWRNDLIAPALLLLDGKRTEAEDCITRCYQHIIDFYKKDGRINESEIVDMAKRHALVFSSFAKRNRIKFDPNLVVPKK